MTKLMLPTSTTAPPASPAPVSVPVPPPVTATATPPAPTPVQESAPAPTSFLSPEDLNDLRRRVLAGEPVDRETLRRARDQLRQRMTAGNMGVKNMADADALAGALSSSVLDF